MTLFDPQQAPVIGVDTHLPSLGRERLQPDALRARFRDPPPWARSCREGAEGEEERRGWLGCRGMRGGGWEEASEGAPGPLTEEAASPAADAAAGGTLAAA